MDHHITSRSPRHRRGVASNRRVVNVRRFRPSIPDAGSPSSWWHAAYKYEEDAGIKNWASRTGNEVFRQLGATRPTRNAESVNFNGKPSLSLTSEQGMQVISAAAEWAFLHNGSGASIFIAQYLTSTTQCAPIWTTRGDRGIGPVQWHGAGGSFLRVYNGNSSFYANEAAPTMYNIPGVFGWRIQTGAVKYKIRGGAWTSSTLTGSPSAAAPIFTLSMGNIGGGGPFIGEIAQIIIFREYISDDRAAAVYASLATPYAFV